MKKYRNRHTRMVALLPCCAAPMAALFETLKVRCTGLSLVDATPLAVRDNLRISRHRVFRGLAARGKSSAGWFFGFKLHLVINHRGELLAMKLKPGNTDIASPCHRCVPRCLASCTATRATSARRYMKSCCSRAWI